MTASSPGCVAGSEQTSTIAASAPACYQSTSSNYAQSVCSGSLPVGNLQTTTYPITIGCTGTACCGPASAGTVGNVTSLACTNTFGNSWTKGWCGGVASSFISSTASIIASVQTWDNGQCQTIPGNVPGSTGYNLLSTTYYYKNCLPNGAGSISYVCANNVLTQNIYNVASCSGTPVSTPQIANGTCAKLGSNTFQMVTACQFQNSSIKASFSIMILLAFIISLLL